MAYGYPRSLVPRLVGLSRRQVVHLAERGIVTPSVRGSSGRGSATLYSHHDLLVMATLRRLLEVTRSELGSRQAAVVAEALAAVEGQPLAERFLVFDAEDCYVIEGAGNVAELARSSSALLLLALEPISDRLSRELLRAGRTVAPAASVEKQRAA